MQAHLPDAIGQGGTAAAGDAARSAVIVDLDWMLAVGLGPPAAALVGVEAEVADQVLARCDIGNRTRRNCNFNGVPDQCEALTCLAELTGPGGMPDGDVNVLELLGLLAARRGSGCADFNGHTGEPDGVVNVLDSLALLSAWEALPLTRMPLR